jgi:flagellar basal-body rod protein FlgF
VIRGIYIAGSGMLAESVRQDVVANNLANATTNGFKRTQSNSEPFAAFLLESRGMPGRPQIGTTNMGVQVGRLDVIDTQGPLRNTGNPLDLALVGKGWFEVNAPGGTRYTRDGALTIDQTGTLVTKEGWSVRGENGPIRADSNGGDIGVAQDGTVNQDGEVLGRIRITELDSTTLAKEGSSLVTGTPTGASTAVVRQSFLEGSTVNVVSEMVELIRVMRNFESNQKAVMSHDETLAQALTKVGVV